MTDKIAHAFRQPDDPGIPSAANPYAPVRFEDSPARSTAWLGSIFIGEVASCTWGRMAMVQVRVLLPDARPLLRADTVTEGKQLLADEVRGWIARTGIKIVEAAR